MIFNFKDYANSVALQQASDCLTYKQLEELSDALASHMKSRSLAFCMASNSIGFVIGYCACLQHGIVPLLLPANIDQPMLENLIEVYKPNYIYAPDQMDLPCRTVNRICQVHGYTLYDTGFHELPVMKEDLCLLLTTSGSTGSPKLARHTYENLRSNILAIVEYLGINSAERPITTLPLYYTYGLSVLNIHLMAGATIILTDDSILRPEFWKLFRSYGATSMAGVPRTFEMLDRMSFFRMNLPSLKSLNQAGGKLNPDLQKKFIDWAADTGREFIVMYGQTEASPRMGYLPWEKAREKYGCMGIPIPGGRFTLCNDEGETISTPETVGELVYHGPNVTPGYAQCREDLARDDERHGVLHTGDMARFDTDGYFTIVGRKARFIKIFGNRVNLDECESILRSEFSQFDCACSGIDDRLIVFITDADYHEEVVNFLSEKTRLNYLGFKVIPIDAIPRNEAGKIHYKDLEKYHA